MLDFPISPTEGQLFLPNVQGVPNFFYRGGQWHRNAGAALPTNRVVNPSMQISQQNGNNIGSLTNWYMADQWRAVTASSGSIYEFSRAAGTVSPRGTTYRIASSTTDTGGQPAAGEYVIFNQQIEGYRIADLNWGTASAKPIILRWGATFSSFGGAGTLCMSLANGAGNRSYVVESAIPNGVPTEFVASIPGDTTGTWAADNTVGIQLRLALTVGSTFRTATKNTWLAGNYMATNSQTQLSNTTGGTVSLFDVGLYVDPNNTGVAPEFHAPSYEDDLKDCQRYWYRAYGLRGESYTTTSLTRMSAPHPVPMRTTPAVAPVGTVRAYDGSGAPNVTGLTVELTSADRLDIGAATGASLIVGRPGGLLVDGIETNYVAVSARM